VVRKLIVRRLLRLLNTQLLNPTPCRYDFVGNIDNFSREDIESSLRQSPAMTLQEYLDIANRFKACPVSRVGVTAIEPDGTYTHNVDFR
jgi:hypothetical protein